MWLCRLRYGNKVEFAGVPICERNTRIVVTSGKLRIGKNCRLRAGTYVAAVGGGQASIADNVFINRNCSIVCMESITIGEHCAFGPNVVVYDHDHRFGMNGITEGYKTAPVIIEKNCWIGAGATILRGAHIREGCIVGAGTVVKGEVPAHSIVLPENKARLTFIPIEEKL